MKKLDRIKVQLVQQSKPQLSLTDPDARSMISQAKGTGLVGYNVQAVVEAKHHLIVAHEVTNVGSDRAQLTPMALAAREAMGRNKLKAFADRGYFAAPQIKSCDDTQISAFVPKPMTSNAKAEGRFSKADFVYVRRDDEYRCPAGERLRLHQTTVEDGLRIKMYWTYACQHCALKSQCTTGKERRVRRWEHEEVLEAMQRRLDRNPHAMTLRRRTIEHVFGTLKHWMGSTHFLTRTLPHVGTEMSLLVLAYNLKRVMQLLGVKQTVKAMKIAAA
jgi:hypothetical protein